MDTIQSSTVAVRITTATAARVQPKGSGVCPRCSNKTCTCNSSGAAKADKAEIAPAAQRKSADAPALTDEQKQQLDQLKKRDAEVRQHEQAHLAAAGGNARSGAVFEYKMGPDGRQYAVGGHVDIDLSAVPGNPAATLA